MEDFKGKIQSCEVFYTVQFISLKIYVRTIPNMFKQNVNCFNKLALPNVVASARIIVLFHSGKYNLVQHCYLLRIYLLTNFIYSYSCCKYTLLH